MRADSSRWLHCLPFDCLPRADREFYRHKSTFLARSLSSALLPTFFVGPLQKIDYRKKKVGTLILTSLLAGEMSEAL